MADKLKLGIIGIGRIGRLHTENIVRRIPEAEVVAVADVRREAAERCAEELGIPNAYQDYMPILEDKTVDAVFICTSTDTHAQLIIEAAEAGKHIFCEKPLALDLEEINRAVSAVRKARVKLQVGFQRRFDPNFARARELIVQGTIGKPHLLRITSRDPEPPPPEYIKVSGGIFLDMTIHDFDMARFLLQDEVAEVYAAGAVLVDPKIGEAGDVDTAVIVLHFFSGALGVIDNSRRAVYGYDQRVEVFGERGMITVGNPKTNTAMVSNAQGDHGPALFHFFVDRYAEAYAREVRAFIDAIREDKEPPVTGEDGKIPVVIAYAAKRSLAEGRPIRLSEIDSSL